MKTGLVLEGGAMRGMYTAGVLDTFLLHRIQVDGVVGASAGALFGVNYLSKQAGRVIRYNKRFNSDPNYMGLRPLLREGNIVNTKYAYEDVPRKLDAFDDEAFRASGIPFYAVVTELESGQPEYLQIKSVLEQMDVLRASASMPFVSKPVALGGKRYLDGGVSDSIPFAWMAAQGYEKLIVVLTRDADYRKKSMPRALSRLMYRNYPRFQERLLTRHTAYNASVEALTGLEKSGRVFVIRPSETISIGRLEKNPDRLQAVYDLGRKDAEGQLALLKEYLR
ncbi:MAG: patatin family protein [Clostridiales bacterium]|nr:patatin family protein [Clostridiales bacterium]